MSIYDWINLVAGIFIGYCCLVCLKAHAVYRVRVRFLERGETWYEDYNQLPSFDDMMLPRHLLRWTYRQWCAYTGVAP